MRGLVELRVEPGPGLRGMPLELFIGWVILWGLVPQLALPRFGIFWSAVVMVAVDCILMPTSTSAIYLKSNWLVGEAAGVAVVLIPALCIAQWTREETNLRGRAALQITTSGLLFLFFVPEIIFALRPGVGWDAMLALPSWIRQIGLQVVLVLALPGIAAVMEFAERGRGTPIPYDPPRQLVTSGIYRYCANPMQLSCALVMLAWAGLLRNAGCSSRHLYRSSTVPGLPSGMREKIWHAGLGTNGVVTGLKYAIGGPGGGHTIRGRQRSSTLPEVVAPAVRFGLGLKRGRRWGCKS